MGGGGEVRGGGGGGGGVLPCKTNGDVPVDGVAFSRLD